MLLRMIGWTAAATLAVVSAPVLAEETGCTSTVARDGSWPAMDTCAPALVLDQHFDAEAIADMVNSHLTKDESVAGHEETTHSHQYASFEDVEEQAEEP